MFRHIKSHGIWGTTSELRPPYSLQFFTTNKVLLRKMPMRSSTWRFRNKRIFQRHKWHPKKTEEKNEFLTLSILWIDQLTLIDDHHRQNLISFNPDIEKWPILGNQGKLLAFYISITAWFQFIGKISCRNKSKGSVARGQSRHISRIHKWKIVSANEWCGLRTLLDWGC